MLGFFFTGSEIITGMVFRSVIASDEVAKVLHVYSIFFFLRVKGVIKELARNQKRVNKE